jgi:hypothetical protein
MATITQTEFQLPTAIISNGAVTGNEWSNPENLLLTDGDVSESNPNETASDVVIGNFNEISLPTDAVITGIEIKLIGAYSGSPTSPSITLTPYFLDNTSGTDTFYPYNTPQTLTTTPTDYVLGSPTYLFATAFSVEQINNAKIQLLANGDIYIDAIKLNVYYYIPDSTGTVPDVPEGCTDCNSPIQAQPFYLALPFLSGDEVAYLESFNYPDGTPIQYSDLGSCGGSIKLVFDPGVPKIGNSNFEENAEVAVWETQANGWVKLTFTHGQRGLRFHTPYDSVPELQSNHDAQSKVIISDSAPFLGQYLQKCQIGTVVSAPIITQYNDVTIVEPTDTFNFKGPGVSVVKDGTTAKITIPGAGGTTPPQIVSVGSATSGSTQTDEGTFDLEISGLNRGAVLQVSAQEDVTVTGVTVGGVACTQNESATDAPNNLRSEIWSCANPPLGTQPVVVSFSAITYWSIGAECLSDIDTAIITGSTQNATGSDNNPTLSLNTTYDYSLIIDSLGTAQTPILYTPGAGQTLNWSKIANTVTRQGGSSIESAGLSPDSITMDYSITQSTPWVYCAVEIKGISAPTPPSGVTVSNDGVSLGVFTELNLIGPEISASDAGGGVADVTVTGGGVGSGSSLSISVNQTGHGLSVGNVIKSSGVANEYDLAQADSAVNAEVVGIVTAVADADNFTYDKDIMGYAGAGIPAGTPGVGVFLSASVAGVMTVTEPTTDGEISKPVGVLIASGSKMNFTADYRGQVNQPVPSTGGGGGGNLTKSGEVSGTANIPGNGGTDTITHSLGFIPNLILLTILNSSSIGGGGKSESLGSASMDDAGVILNQQYEGTEMVFNTIHSSTTKIGMASGNGTTTTPALANVTSTTFDIVWPVTAGINGTPVYKWEVFGGIVTDYTNGTTTKDASDASTTQNIAHGLSTIPKKVKITAISLSDGSADTDAFLRQSITVYNGTTQSSISAYNQGSGGAGVATIDTTFTLNLTNSGSVDTQTGVVTFDDTDIIITWTKTGSPTGTYTLLWEAES